MNLRKRATALRGFGEMRLVNPSPTTPLRSYARLAGLGDDSGEDSNISTDSSGMSVVTVSASPDMGTQQLGLGWWIIAVLGFWYLTTHKGGKLL